MLRAFLLLLFVGWLPLHAVAAVPWDESLSCQEAVAAAERQSSIPTRLLDAISKAETGRRDDSRRLYAWPWTINALGQGHFYSSKVEAVTAARQFLSQGVSSIDVGCLQINLHHHPEAFTSLDDAFDPGANARYGARFLKDLFTQTHGWYAATAAYHSFTPEIGHSYAERVMALWNGQQSPAPLLSLPTPAFTAPVALVHQAFARNLYAPPPHVIRQASGPFPSGGTTTASGHDLAFYRHMPTRLAINLTR